MSLLRPSREQLSSASPDEVAQLAADCLGLLELGRQPLDLFRQLARLTVLSSFEIVPFNKQSDNLRVLLGKRPSSDPWWPNQWHLPGTILLPTDAEINEPGYADIARRILDADFGDSVVQSVEPHVFGIECRQNTRGVEQTALAWTEVELAPSSQSPVGGTFFDVDHAITEPLEGGLVDGHADIIRQALADYSA